MIVVGIDPGLDGAVAILSKEGKVLAVNDSPSFETKTGKSKRREHDCKGMADILNVVLPGPSKVHVFLEKVASMPKQGVRSTFTFGQGYGIWLGIIAAFGYRHELVRPQTWKGQMMKGQPKEKDAARLVAQQMFPEVELHLKKHGGRADALLIAEYGRRVLHGGL